VSTWRPCPNGCGKNVRAYWPDGVFEGEPVPDANDCLWCEGSFNSGAAVSFGLMGMAEAIRERTWACIMCECDTDGDKCEWCAAPRGLRCPACEAGACEDHVRFK